MSNTVRTFALNITKSFMSGLGNLAGNVLNWGKGIIGDFASTIGSIPGMAKDWGTSIVTSTVDGLGQKKTDLMNAVKDRASDIKKWLGFGSAPEGWGQDMDPTVWGQNINLALISGMTQNPQGIAQATQSVARSILNTMHPNNTGKKAGQRVIDGINDSLKSGKINWSDLKGPSVSDLIAAANPAGYTQSGVPGINWRMGIGGVPFGATNFGSGLVNPSVAGANRYISRNTVSRLLLPGSRGQFSDTDFGSRSGKPTNVVLPGPHNLMWKFLGLWPDPSGKGGIEEIWQDPQGHKMAFLHMGEDASGGTRGNPRGRAYYNPQTKSWETLMAGQSYRGGSTVGQTGTEVGSNFNHLCVVTDANGRSNLVWLTSSQMQRMRQQGNSQVQQVTPYSGNLNNNIPADLRHDKIAQLITQNAIKQGIPPALLAALVQSESGGNIRAKSRVGALGLTQLMPGTAKSLGVTNVYDPGQNIAAGAKYLASLYNQFGSWDAALQAYNEGPGAYQHGNRVPGYSQAVQSLARTYVNQTNFPGRRGTNRTGNYPSGTGTQGHPGYMGHGSYSMVPGSTAAKLVQDPTTGVYRWSSDPLTPQSYYDTNPFTNRAFGTGKGDVQNAKQVFDMWATKMKNDFSGMDAAYIRGHADVWARYKYDARNLATAQAYKMAAAANAVFGRSSQGAADTALLNHTLLEAKRSINTNMAAYIKKITDQIVKRNLQQAEQSVKWADWRMAFMKSLGLGNLLQQDIFGPNGGMRPNSQSRFWHDPLLQSYQQAAFTRASAQGDVQAAHVASWWNGLSPSDKAKPANQRLHAALIHQLSQGRSMLNATAASDTQNMYYQARIAGRYQQEKLLGVETTAPGFSKYTEAQKEQWLRRDIRLIRLRQQDANDKAQETANTIISQVRHGVFGDPNSPLAKAQLKYAKEQLEETRKLNAKTAQANIDRAKQKASAATTAGALTGRAVPVRVIGHCNDGSIPGDVPANTTSNNNRRRQVGMGPMGTTQRINPNPHYPVHHITPVGHTRGHEPVGTHAHKTSQNTHNMSMTMQQGLKHQRDTAKHTGEMVKEIRALNQNITKMVTSKNNHQLPNPSSLDPRPSGSHRPLGHQVTLN
jgi:hypothetical protein